MLALAPTMLPLRLEDLLPQNTRPQIPCWDRHGRCNWLESIPGQSLEEWRFGDNISVESQQFLDNVEMALCGHVTGVTLRRQRAYQMLEIVLDGGESWYVRRSLRRREGDPDADVVGERIMREANLLMWLRSYSSIPVPFVVRATPELSILRQMPGKTVRECWGQLDRHQKETVVISYAQYVTELFDLDVPEKIGSTGGDKGGGAYVLRSMPFAGRGPAKRAPKVYDDLQDLIDYIFVSAISEARRTFFASEAESTEAIRLLETLHKVAGSTVRSITTSASCCALSHDDLGDTDVIVNERTGEVSGIVDWEFHSVVPRVMAAHYPSWLRYDGVCDPKYAAEGKWWLSSREESVQMLALFEEVVKSKSQDYHDALFSGTGLRSILEWIYEMGSANYWDRLRRWMAARRMPLHEEKPAVHRQRSATFAL